MEQIYIYVAAHKEVRNYANDSCYKLLHVGAANHKKDFGYICDNTGDNISSKNPMYCELTGVYWLWKNAPHSAFIGVCHYRRFLSKHAYSLNPKSEILTSKEVLSLLQKYDIILPKKLRKTKKNSYCHNEMELNSCREYRYIHKSIQKKCPEYIAELKKVFMDEEMCFGNIFVLSQELFNQYCEWLFGLLFDIEKNIREAGDEVPREYGYLSEWMLNVWVEHNKLKVKYMPIIYTEEKHNIKFFGKLLREKMGL